MSQWELPLCSTVAMHGRLPKVPSGSSCVISAERKPGRGPPSGHCRVSGGKSVPPRGQRCKSVVPAKDFGELLDRKRHALGRWHEPCDGKIGDCEPFANEPGLASQR